MAALGPPRSRDHWPIAPASSPCDRRRPQWCARPAVAAVGHLLRATLPRRRGVACARALLKEHVSDVLDGLKAVTVPRPSPPAHSRLRPSVRRCLQWCRWPALAAKGRLGALGGRPRPPSDHPSCAYLVTVSPRGHAQFSDRMPRTTWLWHGNPSRVSPGTSSRRRFSSRALVHRVHCMAAFARWCLRTVFRQDFVGGQIGNATLRIKFIFQGLKDSKYFQILFYYEPPVTE